MFYCGPCICAALWREKEQNDVSMKWRERKGEQWDALVLCEPRADALRVLKELVRAVHDAGVLGWRSFSKGQGESKREGE